MRGMFRLIDGLLAGDSIALYVLIFAVVGTIIIFTITEVIQRRRKYRRQAPTGTIRVVGDQPGAEQPDA